MILCEERQLLLCGGLAGHMHHPYEVLDPKDLLNFIEKLFTGDLVGTEKVDGVNIFLDLMTISR